MKITKVLPTSITVFASILLLFILLTTRSGGRGRCPQCGHNKDLHKCKHCGWTACLACWQKEGRYTCPGCKRGNP